MTESLVIALGKQAITTAVKVAAPILIASMIIGLLIGIFQAATQIQEQTLTFVPKIITTIVIFLIFGSWMLKTMVKFIQDMFNYISLIVR